MPITIACLFDTCFPLFVLVPAPVLVFATEGGVVGPCLLEGEISVVAVVPGRGVANAVEEELKAEVKEWPFER